MDELVQLVSRETGLPKDEAKMAVETVVDFLKQKQPTIADQIDDALSGGDARNVAHYPPKGERPEVITVRPDRRSD